MRTLPLLAAALAALAGSAALADHVWLMPSISNVAGTQGWVAVDAAASDNLFQFDHRPLQLDQIKVYRPDGATGAMSNALTSRYRSSFDVRLDAPGTWKMAMVAVNVIGTATVNGEQRRVGTFRAPPGGQGGPGGPGGGERPAPGAPPADAPDAPRRQPPIPLAELPADATDLKLAETITRAESFVTLGEPTTAVFGGDPRGITLQPITNPTDLVANEPARFRFLIDGKPAAGLHVNLVSAGQRFRDAEDGMALTTDAQGVVTLKWAHPGYYWLNATAEDARAAEPRAQTRKLSYTATLEVAAP